MSDKLKEVGVLGIGESVIDTIVMVEDLNSEIQTQASIQDIGGPILSALVVLSRLGVDCTFVTSIGDDEAGNKIKSLLKEERINVINFSQTPTKQNLVYVSRIDGRRKKIKGESNHQLINNLDKNFFNNFSYILIDRHQRQAFYEVVANKAPITKIVIDPSTEVSDFTLDMIRLCDYPIIPIETLENLTKKSNDDPLPWLYQLCKKPIVVTAGEVGSYIFDGEKSQLFESFQTAVVDVTGAGDTFRGAFTFGLTQGWSLEKSVQIGNYVAALQCRKIGNVGAIPTTQEMSSFTLNS